MTLDQLHQMVEKAAYFRYLSHNCPSQRDAAKREDWLAAEIRFLNEMGRWPTHDETIPRAKRLYDERCARTKLQDWMQSEQQILRGYGFVW